MASYTIELRRVCEIYSREEVENWFKSYNIEDYLIPSQIEQINKFNIWSKEKLAKKIVDHYYMREIGFETPALFKHYAITSMQEIMERMLPKIYSSFLEYDPLSNVDYVEEYKRTINTDNVSSGSSNSNSNSSSSSLAVNSDTPQGQISKQEILQGEYASNTTATENENNINDKTNTSSSGNQKTLETYVHSMKGDNGVIITNQRLIKEYREIIAGCTEEIIQELSSLFMGIY